MKSKFVGTAIVIILTSIFSAHLLAQQTGTIGDTDIQPFALSGSIGLISEGYSVSGIDPRRPSGMGQINANLNFSILGMRSAVNLLYSTEDDRLRQSMNRFNFQGSWRWLSVGAGTVNPRFSKYSLGGITVTGGLLEIEPSAFSLSLTAGRTRRAVEFTDEPGFRDPSYERWLYAARLGFGRRGGNEFALTGVYSFDVIDSVVDPGEALPAENLNITPEFRVLLFGGSFTLESNVTVSAFTRDRNSEELDMDDVDVPEFLTNIFTPRRSTRIDFAGEVSSRIDLGAVTLAGGYERVQPGFRSLGLGQTRSDQETYNFRPQVRLMNGRINFSGRYSRGRNNLLDTRVSTTKRQQLGGNSMFRFSQAFNLNLSYTRMTNENEPVDMIQPGAAELHQKQVSQTFMLTPTLILRSNMTSHTISLNSSYQILDDQSIAVSNGERQAVDFDNITLGLNYGISLPSGLSFNVTGNLMRNDTGTSKSIGNSVNVSSGYSFFDRTLTVNLNLGWSRNGTEFVQIIEEEEELINGNRVNAPRPKRTFRPVHTSDDILEGEYEVQQWSHQYSINFSASYRLPHGNPIRLTIRGTSSRATEGEGREFDEMRASLRYEHRF